ncbi:MAG: hypothetical protein HRU27_18380 [Rhizobiaceae bacterium]|nr:hypothetical protein [Hyphomicrobiales bacterium]NRB32562.1 hypothetical protein [Rhizobiaceae bacterium]
MSKEEQELADDKARAEIANLIASTAKINAETVKTRLETVLYPAVAGSTLTLAIFALLKALFFD